MSLSVHLSRDLDFREVHRIEEELQAEIEAIGGVEEVYLHMEPSDGGGSGGGSG